MSSLSHHGVKGMKWGVRRTPEELGHINGGEAKVYKLHNYKGHLYFISEKEMDGKTLNPRVPENFLTRYGFEDNTTERICFSHDPGKCLTAMSANVSGKTFNVYEPAEKHDVYKPNRFTVPDAEITGEMWIKEPVKLKKVGSIRCIGDTGEDGLKYTYGNNTAELYDWNYEWLSHASYLEHHGVKGQKWGVRRYQNYDGTRTALGKRRDFERRASKVVEDASNSPRPFVRRPFNKDKIRQRGLITQVEADQCAGLAAGVFKQASQAEPKITSDVIDVISSTSAKMYGLDYRLKQPTSIAAKIGADAKADGITFEQSAGGLKDVIRYTAVSDSRDYVNTYNSIKKRLEEKGYTETKCKNYFQKYQNGEVMHKAVQSTFRSPDGVEFEVQFQTPESQAAKELKVPIYNERRKAGNTPERNAELEQEMRNLAEQVPDPEGVFGIESHSGVKNMKHSSLSHHGVDGQQWGLRRYQYEDGTLTPLGREHYGYGDEEFQKRRTEAAKSRKEVLKNMDLFTTDELQELSARFNAEDQLKRENIEKGLQVMSDLAQVANNAYVIGRALGYFGAAEHSSLSHHGIIGQHWGEKHGPPYPLNREVSSKIKREGWRDIESDEKKSKKYADRMTGMSAFLSAHDNEWEEVEDFGDSYENVASIIGSSLSSGGSIPSKYSRGKTGFDNIHLWEVNPEYGSGGTTNNCAKNAATVELLGKGFNVTAGRQTYGTGVGAMEYWFKGAKTQKIDKGSSISPIGPLEEAIRASEENGKSSGTLDFFYPGGAGHSVHYYHEFDEEVGNTWLIQDGQSNHSYEALSDYFIDYGFDRNKSCYFTRLDNCEPDWDHLAEDSVVKAPIGSGTKVRNRNNGRIVDRW